MLNYIFILLLNHDFVCFCTNCLNEDRLKVFRLEKFSSFLVENSKHFVFRPETFWANFVEILTIRYEDIPKTLVPRTDSF